MLNHQMSYNTSRGTNSNSNSNSNSNKHYVQRIQRLHLVYHNFSNEKLNGVWNILKEVSQSATKIPSRTRVVLLRKRKGKSIRHPLRGTSTISELTSCVANEPIVPGSTHIWSRCCLEFVSQPPAPKSNPLSPGQTCCHQVPKHLCHTAVANLVRSRNCHYASRGVGRIALRD
ncbi:hypothetical protein PIB30_046007 [Stylosanthes scabra]|uniref:Uncharacterized protein n=1 Tax=Stylosanthes scabra TaxID=79078 RepID=A0ABU6VFD4_9FABA|nr:hypothetical protein [Stylosanthes scabra]